MPTNVVRSDVFSTRTITAALIGLLENATGKPFGDHEAPTLAVPETGYGIVYAIPGGTYNGPPFWAPEADAVLIYQISSVGRLRDQTEWLADRVRLTLCSRVDAGGFQVPFTPLVGMKVIHREPDGSPPGVIPEGPPGSRIYTVPERFRLHVESTSD